MRLEARAGGPRYARVICDRDDGDPAGVVVGADLAAPLAALATHRAGEVGAGNVTICVVDMQTGTVSGQPFDLVLSQFGVMFFDGPQTAFTKIRELPARRSADESHR